MAHLSRFAGCTANSANPANLVCALRETIIRLLGIIKARGIAHSTKVREFRFTSHGVEVGGTSDGPPGNATPEDDSWGRMRQTARSAVALDAARSVD